MLQKRQKVLARAPSTRDPRRTSVVALAALKLAIDNDEGRRGFD
jgi:hypothetical protein